jgi:hypothetical protein
MNRLKISTGPLGPMTFSRMKISLSVEFLLCRRRRGKIYSLPPDRHSGRRLQGRLRGRRRALTLDALAELNLIKIQ